MQDFFLKLASLLAFLPLFYGACAVVQLTVVRPKTRYVVIGSFATLAALISLTGLLAFAVPGVLERRSGTLLLVIAGVTILPLIKSVRRLLARLTPIDPNSTVDISGVIVAFWLLVLAAAALFTVDLDQIANEVNITVADSIINVFAYPALAFSLIGVWVTRGPRESVKRLGIEPLRPRQVGVALALVAPLLIVGIGVDALGRQLQPALYAQLERVLQAMSSNVTNPAVALIIGLSAGIGEEILLRGAIQPRLGIGLTALLFAVAHTQYGASYAVVGIFLVSIVLGYERRYMNTTACIITHGAYNTVAFLLAYYTASGA